MNARFTEVLNSLEQKNETVKQKTIVKQSRQECDPSDAVVDNAGPTSTDSVVKETDKSDVGIEKQSDIAVEEIQPLESIIPGREHDLALMIYKPPPTTPAEYGISDNAILSAFSMPQKNVLANKNAPAPCSRKPSNIYHSPFLTHFGSSSKGKKKLTSNERKFFSFEGYHITGDSPTVEMEIFKEWIHDGLYKQHTEKKDDDDHYKHLDVMYYLRKKYKNTNFSISRYTTTDYFFKVYINKAYANYYNSDVAKDLATQDTSARTDEVADMEKSLINTIKGLSTCADQPWHIVNEVFFPINCDNAFHWVLAVISLKDRCICVYDSMASSRKRKQTSDIEKLAVIILIYLQYSKFFEHKVPTDWTALKSYEGNSERDPF
ncbi:hypothetical protein FXO38_19823 [Capsicum annuum]|nr:hypothetical protein FXO38_19823 [Capsicum annuum]